MGMANDFWPNCGHQTLAVDDDNRLCVSDDFLRLFYARPELAPVDESCAAECALHARLMDTPKAAVGAHEIARIEDGDARENYRFALAFRDLLLQYTTLENAYLNVVSARFGQKIPPVLVDWLVQIILKHILLQMDENLVSGRGETPLDSYRLRAAELFFRRQKADLSAGIVLADADWLRRHSRPQQQQGLGLLESLIQQAGGVVADARQEAIEVLTDSNSAVYYRHSESYRLALDFGFTQAGIHAFAQVLAAWLSHFHGITGSITPLQEIQDDHWRWHIGLDVESNALLNKLYRNLSLDENEQNRLLALFRLDIETHSCLRPETAGYPVYLGLALNENRELRLKPQNLLLNLPLAKPA